MIRRALGTLAVLAALWSSPTAAQYMFLDVDDDGLPTAADAMEVGVENRVDVWLVTDEMRNGAATEIRAFDGRKPPLFSYQFVLRADGGTVEWGEFENAISTMVTDFGTFRSATEFSAGHGGPSVLPPGRYRLGSLSIRVASGNPAIRIVSASEDRRALTAFGSMAAGRDGDHTLKFVDSPRSFGKAGGEDRGDWFESVGLAPARTTDVSTESQRGPKETFGVSLSPNPANPTMTLRVTTTRVGRLAVRLYDTQGRLIRVVTDQRQAPSGPHVFTIRDGSGQDRLGSGVIFYRVDAEEGTRSGKFALLK